MTGRDLTAGRFWFRAGAGLLALAGGLAGLYLVPIPEGNREPLLLALGLVLGWGSTVIGYEFGSSPASRRVAGGQDSLAGAREG